MKVDLLLKLIQRLQDASFTGSVTVRIHRGNVAKHVEQTEMVNLLPDDRRRGEEQEKCQSRS